MAAINGFEAFMNFIIPVALVVVMLGFVYVKFKEPIRKFFGWLSGLFSSANEKVKGGAIVSRDIVINY